MRDLRYVGETGSTNSDVAILAQAGAAEGLWLRAGRQTEGRGRQARPWESFAGNLHASTFVTLRAGDPLPATLAFVAAVAVHQTAEAYGAAGACLKWPNDLLLRGGKLAGILLERHGDTVVIGFGVNLLRHPERLDRPVTSFPACGIAAPDAEVFLADLADAFARWLGRWRGEGLAPILAGWMASAHPVGTPLSVHAGDGAITEGLFDGLAADGALRLRLADGSRHVMHAGDVFLI